MSAVQNCLDGATASCVALVVSNPFDVMRTRFQLQGEMLRRGSYEVRYRNLAQGMWRVASEEGLLALQKGFAAATCWQITQNGIRIGLYPIITEHLQPLSRDPVDGSDRPAARNTVRTMSAGICGVIGAAISSPFVMIKTRVQAASVHSLRARLGGGAAPAAVSASSLAARTSVWSSCRAIYREGGVRGLWRGVLIATQRTGMFSISQLVSYDMAKEVTARRAQLPDTDVRVHLMASTLSAACIVVCTNPFDVVMTRSYNAARPPARMGCGGGGGAAAAAAVSAGSNFVPTQLLKIYRVEGIRGLYKGSTAMFSRTAPHTIVTFVTLEYIRALRQCAKE
ncbi:solute carrier family 25, member 34/35 [Strigomonas culicis]|uniref:Solute carrier family 25, member 34/35 n=1 Tax=Strigomonas culicis TaxID=28005 RepID=S9TSC1_9TRYP|nr:solute carrier family 25, member 34/35 [Strigomonas culicis]|eukprot:EPY21287.1 solute carrier family 25, member 34/35 [Strigomonas culicis]